MTTKFMDLVELTGDASGWSSTAGAVSIESSVVRTGHARSLKVDTGAGPAEAKFVKTGILADAGRRITFYFRYPTSFAATAIIGSVINNAQTLAVFRVQMTTSGTLLLTNSAGTSLGTGSTVLATNTSDRLCLAYTISSTTVYSVRLYLNGNSTPEISVTNGTALSATDSGVLQLELSEQAGTNRIAYFSDCYVDDSTDLTDTGDINLAAKFPDEDNTVNFESDIGTGAVNERPISETNGRQHTLATDVQENYTLQTAAEGDFDISTATLVARTALVWAKRGAFTAIGFVNAGAEGSAASGGITLGAPASPVSNYVWIAVIHSADNVNHTLTDWTPVAQFNGGTSASRISIWEFRYAGSTPNLIVGHTAGATIVGGIAQFSGCKTSGSAVNGVATNSTGTGTQAITGLSPGVRDCMVLVCTGRGDDDAYDDNSGTGWTNAFEDAAGGTQRNYGSAAGTPDGSVGVYYKLQTAIAASGTVTASTAATDPWAGLQIALEPEATVGSPDIMDNGSETAITLTATSSLYTLITDSASYPSNAAGIGMRSGGGRVDTFLYDCGVVIAYLPFEEPPTGQPAVKRMGGVEFAHSLSSSTGRVW